MKNLNLMSIVLIVLAVLAMSSTECSTPQTASQTAQIAQANMAEAAANNVPIPTITYFQEKRTIAKWAEAWDKPDIDCYVYLFSYGKCYGYYISDGKPASTRSYLMPEEAYQRMAVGTSGGYNWELTQAPDIDGTYGQNNAGIRFFTIEGDPVEWGGEGNTYYYSTHLVKAWDVPKLNITDAEGPK